MNNKYRCLFSSSAGLEILIFIVVIIGGLLFIFVQIVYEFFKLKEMMK